MSKVIKFFYDLETTGLDPRKHSIHQLAGYIEVGGEIVRSFNLKMRPHDKALIDPDALSTCKVTEEQIRAYPTRKETFTKLIKMLGKYVDKYTKTDKMYLVGYNNRSFDDVFFRAWFEQMKDMYFGSWFFSDSLDTLVLASNYLIGRRRHMPNFQLCTVAQEVGIIIEEERLHDAMYDIELTRSIYRIVTDLEMEW